MDAVVAPDLAVLLDAQDVLEGASGVGDEGRTGFGGGTAKRALKSGRKWSLRYRFAAAGVVMFSRRSSGGSRFWRVAKARSMRPRASGE